jgi:3-dehydroquinate synthase
LLNFGHTWGHALELATSFAIPHGLAVAIGMLAAIRFTQEQPSSAALWNHCLALLSPVIELTQLQAFNPDRFLQAFRADKKHSPGHIHLIVPTAAAAEGLGVEEVRLPATEASLASVLQAMREALAVVEQQIRVSPVFPSPGAPALV